MKSWTIFLVFIIKLLIQNGHILADHVHGCGGFIKSHAEIDFSKVEVNLLTKSGVKKDSVEANPTNGYYFLPVYEKGLYLLKVRDFIINIIYFHKSRLNTFKFLGCSACRLVF